MKFAPNFAGSMEGPGLAELYRDDLCDYPIIVSAHGHQPVLISCSPSLAVEHGNSGTAGKLTGIWHNCTLQNEGDHTSEWRLSDWVSTQKPGCKRWKGTIENQEWWGH